jgi:hypothetical protein
MTKNMASENFLWPKKSLSGKHGVLQKNTYLGSLVAAIAHGLSSKKLDFQ